MPWAYDVMKLTILKRLIFGYVAMMLLVAFLGGYVTLKLNKLNQLAGAIASVDSVTIRPIENLLDTILSQVSFEKKYLIAQDKDFYQQFKEIEAYIARDMVKIEDLLYAPDKKRIFDDAKRMYGLYLSCFKEEVDFKKRKRNYSLEEYQQKKEKILDTIDRKLKKIIMMMRSDRAEMIHSSSQISSHVLRVTTITAGLVVIVGILISFYNTRTINRSISLLQKKTKEIAQGKFREISNIVSPPEIKELADDFNIMCKRLQELDEMKIDFINHVSHELRTPLTVIKEASGMLREGVFTDAPKKEHELLTMVYEECERLIHSVSRILDLSCMEARMMDYHFRKCPLSTVIKKSVIKLAPIAQRKNINIEFNFAPDLPMVNIDEERIGQVLENLVGNALKFSGSGGIISICASLNNGNKRHVEVLVSDAGCGISSENLEKIFDKFKRIEGGMEAARGTGLGLSISKYIIAAHGEKIWAESELGKGATFFFTLPV